MFVTNSYSYSISLLVFLSLSLSLSPFSLFSTIFILLYQKNRNDSMILLQVRHTVSWEGVWRNLRCINRSTAFAVREHSGHSLKSSLKHALVTDTRDSNVFPTEGVLFR